MLPKPAKPGGRIVITGAHDDAVMLFIAGLVIASNEQLPFWLSN
jgi:shikimate kinase